jgi:hypothetical protein
VRNLGNVRDETDIISHISHIVSVQIPGNLKRMICIDIYPLNNVISISQNGGGICCYICDHPLPGCVIKLS